MAKIYREEQRYHDLPSLSLIALFLTFIAYQLLSKFLYEVQQEQLLTLSLLLIGLTLSIALLWTIRLKIRISSKKLRINLSPISWTGLQLKKEEIDAVEFFQVSEGDLCSGWALHFGSDTRIFNFGDHSGIIIHRSSGQKIILFSDKLYHQRHELQDSFQQYGWNTLVQRTPTS